MTDSNDDVLLARLRRALGDDPNIAEKRMFGGIAFMLNGNMLCGVTSKGQFMARVGKALEAEARTLPGAQDMDFTGKKWSVCCLSKKARLRVTPWSSGSPYARVSWVIYPRNKCMPAATQPSTSSATRARYHTTALPSG